VFAAACDFSKRARDVFHDGIRALGVSEAYIWGRGEIEDLLYQPKNDHLLFAYFGFSLQMRKRTLKTQIRSILATKKKAEKHLRMRCVLIRDATDDRYPHLDKDQSKARFQRGRWIVMNCDGVAHDGVRIHVGSYRAFLDTDGVQWDFAETENEVRVWSQDDPWCEDSDDTIRESHCFELWQSLPKECQAYFKITKVIPYEAILAIDEAGDDVCRHPHIFVGPQDDRGPFLPYEYATLETVHEPRRWADPIRENRVERFPRRKRPQRS
jgi:hypothetical protein